jgi:predicted unusual protein kinase regulating ubiquinone biosynthesis (AarF/ABC1/UbiB family)
MSKPYHVESIIEEMLRPHSYRTTLNQRDKLEDDEEREHVLKACHKRCALRTLKVLEQNGGIFIKLGQHLVGLQKTRHATRADLGSPDRAR